MQGYGKIQVYTGDGKGKTSAALGVAFRACARGAKVLMLAFLKDDPEYSEAIGAHLLPGFTLKQVGRDAFVNFKNPDKIDLDMARAGWELAKEAIAQQQADVIILDEINIVLQTGMLPVSLTKLTLYYRQACCRWMKWLVSYPRTRAGQRLSAPGAAHRRSFAP